LLNAYDALDFSQHSKKLFVDGDCKFGKDVLEG
jgi:hypothetical protein